MNSKPITDPNRALRLMGVLNNNVDLSKVPDSTVEWALQHPKEAGAQFTAFLKNGGRVIVGESKIITIDRTTPFDLKFLGDGWTIEEEDERSLALTEIDLTNVHLETMLKDGENVVGGEEKLKRLKEANNIRLDAKVFQTLWKNKNLIPESWKKKTRGKVTHIYFDGTIFKIRNNRFILSACWICSAEVWNWRCNWLDSEWTFYDPSAVLTS